MIQRLDRVVPEPSVEPPALPFTEHMQGITREIAHSLESWTPTRKDEMTRLFDRLSTDWRTGTDVAQDDALEDALERGRVDGRGIALDVGSGTGVFTASLARRFELLVSVDLSLEMLGRASAGARRVCADGADLPFPDGAVTTVVIANCFLFPTE